MTDPHREKAREIAIPTLADNCSCGWDGDSEQDTRAQHPCDFHLAQADAIAAYGREMYERGQEHGGTAFAEGYQRGREDAAKVAHGFVERYDQETAGYATRGRRETAASIEAAIRAGGSR